MLPALFQHSAPRASQARYAKLYLVHSRFKTTFTKERANKSWDSIIHAPITQQGHFNGKKREFGNITKKKKKQRKKERKLPEKKEPQLL